MGDPALEPLGSVIARLLRERDPKVIASEAMRSLDQAWLELQKVLAGMGQKAPPKTGLEVPWRMEAEAVFGSAWTAEMRRQAAERRSRSRPVPCLPPWRLVLGTNHFPAVAATQPRGRISRRSEQTPDIGWWRPQRRSTVRGYRPRTAVFR